MTRSRAADLRPLLAPTSVAVVGASQRPDAAGTIVVRNLVSLGFQGPIYPVNRRYSEVDGLRCYPSLDALPSIPEAVFVAIPAASGPDVIDDAGRLGIRAAFVNASGYADGGTAGAMLQARIQASAAQHGMAICGPNNQGLINFHDRAALWTFEVPAAQPGGVAVITQSGSASLVLGHALARVGLAYVITSGNEAVVDVSEYLDWVAADPRVSVVAIFIETIRDPAGFRAAALRCAARGVAIAAIKVGQTERGGAAVAAHTGALAGDDRAFEAFFRASGVIRVDDYDELVNLVTLLAGTPSQPAGSSVVAVTLSGGEAALTADIGSISGLDMLTLSPGAVERVRSAMPPWASPRNPLDVWGVGFEPERFGRIVRGLLLDEPGVLTVMVNPIANGAIDADFTMQIVDVLAGVAPTTATRMVIVNNAASLGLFAPLLERAEGANIPVLTGMRASLRALERWTHLRPPESPALDADDPVVERPTDGLAALSEAQQFQRVADAGVPMAPTIAAGSEEAAVRAADQLGYPVVVKGSVRGVLHKSDQGLIALDLRSPDAVRVAAQRLLADIGGRSGELLVQHQAERGVELIVGTRQVLGFGTLVAVGPGGMLAEVMHEVSVRFGPVDEATALAMLHETSAAKLLAGVRGQPPADIQSATRAIARISQLAHDARTSIGTVEVNPLIVLAAGRGCVGVDVVLVPIEPVR